MPQESFIIYLALYNHKKITKVESQTSKTQKYIKLLSIFQIHLIFVAISPNLFFIFNLFSFSIQI